MKTWPFKNSQVLNYLFWCIMTTAVSWITYSLCIWLLEFVWFSNLTSMVLAANIVSWVCAVSFSFVANKKLVFSSRSWELKIVLPEVLKFFSTRAAVGVFEILLATFMVYIGLDQPLFGVDGLVSKMIVTPIVILMNYICGRFLVFNKPSQ